MTLLRRVSGVSGLTLDSSAGDPGIESGQNQKFCRAFSWAELVLIWWRVASFSG